MVKKQKKQTYKPPYLRWYDRDFWSSPNVRALSPMARHLYRTLLLASWNTDKPAYLPTDETQLKTLADSPSDEIWEKHKVEIFAMFVKKSGWYTHKRLLKEYKAIAEEHKSKSYAGRKGRQVQLESTTSKDLVNRAQPGHSPSTARANLGQTEPEPECISRSISRSIKSLATAVSAETAFATYPDAATKNTNPVEKVVEIYNATVSTYDTTKQYFLPPVGNDEDKTIKAIIRFTNDNSNWEEKFNLVMEKWLESDFLMHGTNTSIISPNLSWLFKDKNTIYKVLNNKYKKYGTKPIYSAAP